MADRYTFFISGTVINQFHPIYANCQIKKEKIDVKERTTIEGTLKFGGQYKEAEYDELKTLVDSGKLIINIKENGTTIIDGNLIMDGDWDDDKKTVELEIETIDIYTPYFENIDTEKTTADWNITVIGQIKPVLEFAAYELPDGIKWKLFQPTIAGSAAAGYARIMYNGIISGTNDIEDGKTYFDWDIDNPLLEDYAEIFYHDEKPDQDEYIFLYETHGPKYWMKKSNINYIAKDTHFYGGRGLDDVLNDLYVGDVSDQINISELNIDKYYVFNTGSITKNIEDYKDISIGIVNELMEKLFHIYVSITKPVSTIISKFKIIKNVIFSVGVDLTNYKNKNWAKNRNKYTINNNTKPAKTKYTMQGTGDFSNQDVFFDKALKDNEPENISISNWVSDIQDAIENSDNYSGKFFIIKATTVNVDTQSFNLINDIGNPIPLLNGSSWTSSTLNTFTLNGAGQALSILGTLNDGDTIVVQVNSPYNVDGGGLLELFLTNSADQVMYSYNLLNNGALKQSYSIRSTEIYKLKFVTAFNLDINVSGITIYKTTRTIDSDIGALTGDSVVNGELSLANLLEDHIAEMPYNKANFNNNNNVTVDKKRDKTNVPINIPSIDDFDSVFDFEKSVNGSGTNDLIPVTHTRNMNGDFDEFISDY